MIMAKTCNTCNTIKCNTEFYTGKNTCDVPDVEFGMKMKRLGMIKESHEKIRNR